MKRKVLIFLKYVGIGIAVEVVMMIAEVMVGRLLNVRISAAALIGLSFGPIGFFAAKMRDALKDAAANETRIDDAL
jgi:hypothetical protein